MRLRQEVTEMQEVTLTPKIAVKIPVDGENIKPDTFAGKSAAEIKALDAWNGNTKMTLSDFFDVTVNGSAAPGETKIIIEGNVTRIKRIGEGMTAGSIEIRGDVDMHVGNNMRGGSIVVKGYADGWAGREMKGGELIIEGNAGHYVGSGYRGESCGMRGGTITVNGNAADFVGEHLCGGIITIKGNTGIMPGISNNGGTIIIEGNTTMPGAEMQKGTIVIKGTVAEMIPVYREAGVEEYEGVSYRKFTGDVVIGGKGVLLVK